MKGLALDNGKIAAGSFDFDGNILKTKTMQYFVCKVSDKIIEVPGYEVDANPEIYFGDNAQYLLHGDDTDIAFRNYRCVNPHDDHRGFTGLIDDIERALSDNEISLSFTSFKDIFLVKGRIWSLITARGNSVDNFQKGFEIINREMLSESEKEEQIENIRKNYGLDTHNYTDIQVLLFYFRNLIVDYVCCSNAHTQRQMQILDPSGAVRKTQAMSWWMKEVRRKLDVIRQNFSDTGTILDQDTPIAWGFSDDGVSNVTEMAKFFGGAIQGDDKARVYFTGDESRFDAVKQRAAGFGEIINIKQGGNNILQIRI